MPKTVLIVDDNEAIRKAMREAFARSDGFDICGEAVDGRDAVQKARRLKPDLIVMDLSMPVMNGLQAGRILTRQVPSAALLLFTMFAIEIVEADAREAGFRGIVSKSQGVEMLVSQGRVVLGLPA
jgi:DNA-binding NarL/FixJ family response regulator